MQDVYVPLLFPPFHSCPLSLSFSSSPPLSPVYGSGSGISVNLDCNRRCINRAELSRLGLIKNGRNNWLRGTLGHMQTTAEYAGCLTVIENKQPWKTNWYILKFWLSLLSIHSSLKSAAAFVWRIIRWNYWWSRSSECTVRKTNWATLLQNNYKWFGFQDMPSPLDLPTVKKAKAGAC